VIASRRGYPLVYLTATAAALAGALILAMGRPRARAPAKYSSP